MGDQCERQVHRRRGLTVQASAESDGTLDEYVKESYNTYDLIVIKPILTATIKVKKEDGKGNPLAGAEFTMTGTNVGAGGPYTATSDANGIATFTGVKAGSYDITETKAPFGYRLDTTPKPIDVDANGKATISVEGGNQFQEYDAAHMYVFENEQYKATFYVT